MQNILFFRFSNSIFEPLWNSRNIDNIQITVDENIGIEHRGKYYEQAGVVRDMVQNHIIQIVAIIAMEVPVGFDANYIRDEKDVDKNCNTTTFIAAKLFYQHLALG